MVGIQNLKQAALVACQFGNAVDASLEDGFQMADLFALVGPLSQIPAIVANKELLLEEWKDLESDERDEIIDFIEQALDLRSDKLEEQVEKGLLWVAVTVDFVGTFKKEETEEPPVE